MPRPGIAQSGGLERTRRQGRNGTRWRNGVSASTHNLRGMDLSGWDTTTWRLPYSYKEV